MNRKLFIAACAFLLLNVVSNGSAEAQLLSGQRFSAQQRAGIRAMPILERPSRPFHFYGNTVRRNAPAMVPQSRKMKPGVVSDVRAFGNFQPNQNIPEIAVPSVRLPIEGEKLPVTVKPISENRSVKTINQTKREEKSPAESKPINYSSRRVFGKK